MHVFIFVKTSQSILLKTYKILWKSLAVKVTTLEGGKLAKSISESKKYLIQELSVYGYYSANEDNPFIKELCNALEDNKKEGRLEALDLSNAMITSFKNCNAYTLKNDDFVNCKTLKKIIFSRLDSLDAKSFSGCTSLESIEYKDNVCFQSIDGIIYQKGRFVVYYSDYRDFESGKWILIKYPAAKKEVKQIRFNLINQIADYAFEDSNITDLYMQAIPPVCTDKAFFNVDTTKITLHVPVGSYHSYWSHPIWGEFRIVEEDQEM